MSKIEEDGLDKIFKRRLQEPGHLAEYRESDWDALEEMLDGHKSRPVIFWLRIASGIAAVLLLGFGWLYLQSGNNTGTKQPLAIHHTNRNSDSSNNNATIAQAKPASAGNSAAVTATTNAGNGNNKDNTGTSGGTEHQTAGALTQIPPSVNRNPVLAMDKHYHKGKSFFTLSGLAARRDTAGSVNVNTDNINMGQVETLAALSEQKIDAQKQDEAIIFTDMQYNPAVISIKDPLVSSKRRAQFALSVFASPNINGVNTFNNAEVGANIGLQFSVTVSKFTFSTGAAYAKAPYLTPFSNYPSTYPFKVPPVNVSADCRVLDIPLNIDYRVYSKAKNQFSVGSGLSSYIMLRENYSYNYAIYYPNWPTGLSITNQNQHFFGVLNLDATYQRKINSKFSLNVQPYLKIPLTDIGYSQVKLQSAGVAFGLTWNLNSLAKP
jgi:hypothetical protein